MDFAHSTENNVFHHEDGKKLAESWVAEGIRCYKIYKKSGKVETLDNAIRYARDGLSLTIQGHESYAVHLGIFTMLLGARYRHIGDRKDLEEAIDTARRAVQSSPPDHPNSIKREEYLDTAKLIGRLILKKKA
jgi:hypothetical protein